MNNIRSLNREIFSVHCYGTLGMTEIVKTTKWFMVWKIIRVSFLLAKQCHGNDDNSDNDNNSIQHLPCFCQMYLNNSLHYKPCHNNMALHWNLEYCMSGLGKRVLFVLNNEVLPGSTLMFGECDLLVTSVLDLNHLAWSIVQKTSFWDLFSEIHFDIWDTLWRYSCCHLENNLYCNMYFKIIYHILWNEITRNT